MFETLKHYWELWKSSKKFYDKQPYINREKDELEFLPAAIEVLETPVSPVGRAAAISIVAIFCFAVIWAYFGKINMEAVAQGKIIPISKVKAIQSLQIGKVEAIYVEEGEYVEKGQLLVKLDPTESEVDVNQVIADLKDARLNAHRLEKILTALDQTSPKVDFHSSFKSSNPEFVKNIPLKQIELQQWLLDRDLELFDSMGRKLQAAMEQQHAMMGAVNTNIERLRTMEPLFTEQEKVTKKLRDKGHVSYVDWLAYKEKQVSTTQELQVQKSKLMEAKAQLISIQSDGLHEDRQFRAERLNQLKEYRRKVETNQLALTKAKEREQNQYLRAPVSGVIQQLQVHTIGGVVQPAQPIMVIVPENVKLEVEAMVLNKDIGFIREGMPAEIKVDSFPYTKYGLVIGTVRKVSKDAVEQEGLGLVYPIRVTIGENRILVEDHWNKLQPGMSVEVDISTGKRRLIEYFLAPFLKYQDESLRER
ncbi:hypothetical protein SOPP22_05820 [Shewanella sp. OPT22]|nr:hypothetical protein SOPP22_05820 [Shewanella sp. OPT22]